MDFKEIEKMFENEEQLGKLLQSYSEVFDKIDYYQDLFQNGAIDTPGETDKIMKELTGIFMSISIIATIADSEKTNRESRKYNTLRIEASNRGEKPVVAQLDREASAFVAPYRKIRNIFQAYRDVCDRAISVCQSSLRFMDKEKRSSGNA